MVGLILAAVGVERREGHDTMQRFRLRVQCPVADSPLVLLEERETVSLQHSFRGHVFVGQRGVGREVCFRMGKSGVRACT